MVQLVYKKTTNKVGDKTYTNYRFYLKCGVRLIGITNIKTDNFNNYTDVLNTFLTLGDELK